MTETVGYLCPNCLSWWTCYLCKNGKLYCKCDVPEEEWFYIYRKTYGNRIFGISEKSAKVSTNKLALRIDLSDVVNYDGLLDKSKLKAKVKELLKKQNKVSIEEWPIFYIGFKKAFSQASSNQWFERCPKCKHFRGGRNCNQGYTWFTVDCQDFDLKDSIKKFIEMGGTNYQ